MFRFALLYVIVIAMIAMYLLFEYLCRLRPRLVISKQVRRRRQLSYEKCYPCMIIWIIIERDRLDHSFVLVFFWGRD